MMQPWFPQAKLGIFIHWGIYAVKGVAESWSFYNGQISYDDYMAQCDGFTADRYDPAAWADLFKRAGARYAVLTTKHHDGVALWDTTLSDLNVVKKTPAGRDLVAPFVRAVRDAGLHLGLYFSHLDWSHPDYATVLPQRHKDPNDRSSFRMNKFAFPPPGVPESPQRWERFLAFHRGQLRELCERFQPELLWFDGDWDRDEDQWRFAELRQQLHTWSPGVILNSRMLGHGDYATPEQGIPIARPQGPWEFCVTLNDSWGYQHHDKNYKSVRQIVRMFAECIAMGGNMLLDVGPMADGTIPAEQVERLEALGRWIERHAEAVYDTTAGLPAGHFYGASTLSLDRRTLYLYCFDRPWESVAVKGIRNTVRRVSVVGTDRTLSFKTVGGAPWMNIPGVLWIDVPEEELNPNATVLKLELDSPLDLYEGAGHAITSN